MLENRALSLFFIVALSFFLCLMPWDSIYKDTFIDRLTYYNLMVYYENRINYVEYNYFIDYIKEEWLWSYLTFLWSDYLNLNVFYLFGIISFFCIFSSLLILRLYKSLYLSIFLFNPIFIEFFYSQLRLALAISLIFLAYYIYNKNKIISFILLFLSIFLHTTSLIFIFPIFIFNIVKKTLNRFIICIIVPIIIGMLTGTFRYTFLSYIGDRRVDYNDMSGDWYILFFYFLLFITLIFSYVFQKNKENIPDIYYISLFSLSLCFFCFIFGSYPSRFLAALYVFILLSFNFIPSKIKSFAFIGHLFYIIFGFILWTGI